MNELFVDWNQIWRKTLGPSCQVLCCCILDIASIIEANESGISRLSLEKAGDYRSGTELPEHVLC